MIGRIKNAFLRRLALLLAFPPAVAFLLVAGVVISLIVAGRAAYEEWEDAELGDILTTFRDCWHGR